MAGGDQGFIEIHVAGQQRRETATVLFGRILLRADRELAGGVGV